MIFKYKCKYALKYPTKYKVATFKSFCIKIKKNMTLNKYKEIVTFRVGIRPWNSRTKLRLVGVCAVITICVSNRFYIAMH